MTDAGRGASLGHLLSDGLEVGFGNDGVMVTRHADAELVVAADVDGVTQQVANTDHAPVAPAASLNAFFIEALRDPSDAESVAQTKAEDAPNHGRFLFVDLVAAILADAVAIGWTADGLAESGTFLQSFPAPVGIGIGIAVQTPEIDQRRLVDRSVIERDKLDAPSAELEHGSDGMRGIVAEIDKALGDDEGEAARLFTQVAQQLRDSGALAVVRGVGIEECGGRLEPVLVAVLEKVGVLDNQRGIGGRVVGPRRVFTALTEISDGTHRLMLCAWLRQD